MQEKDLGNDFMITHATFPIISIPKIDSSEYIFFIKIYATFVFSLFHYSKQTKISKSTRTTSPNFLWWMQMTSRKIVFLLHTITTLGKKNGLMVKVVGNELNLVVKLLEDGQSQHLGGTSITTRTMI